MPQVLICKMEMISSFKVTGRGRFCTSTRGLKHHVGSLHTLPAPPPGAEATMQGGWRNRSPCLRMAQLVAQISHKHLGSVHAALRFTVSML